MNPPVASWLLGLGVACLLLVLVAAALLVRNRRYRLDSLLRKIAWEQLRDIVVPDEVDGEIHVDLALLTRQGILVLEVRRATGTLFWGEQLDRWTVLDGVRRKVIENPMPGLRARRHAVHALVPTVPVSGRVLLVGTVDISGGRPPGVLVQHELLAEFPACTGRPPQSLADAWNAFKASVRPL